jgi:hypothetical protein
MDDMSLVSPLLRHAEEILDTAIAGTADIGIIVSKHGALRFIDAAGWSLPAMRTEFGAAAVYKVERGGCMVRVQGWDGDRICRVEKCVATRPLRNWQICCVQPH